MVSQILRRVWLISSSFRRSYRMEHYPKTRRARPCSTCKIAALEKPAPQPIPPLPKMAQTVSGKKYVMDDGEAFTLTFTGDQATLDWSFKDQSIQLPVGMDNVFRTTPYNQTEALSFFGANQKPLGPIFFALRGGWTTDDTFVLTMQILNSANRHTLRIIFSGDKVRIIHTETASGDSVSFQGQVQSQVKDHLMYRIVKPI